VLGGWRWNDAAIILAIVALQPFTEWITHVVLLHARPRTVFGVKIDALAARKHREHHADPSDTGLVFIPMQVLVTSLIGGVILYGALFRDLRLATSAMLISLVMLVFYEWTHHLIHSRYLPKTRVYRYVWRAHRLHHFRNENYWFGVTVHLADHLLRTFPAKDAVPLSPTCRTLGVDVTA
jgi:hypothetical protein